MAGLTTMALLALSAAKTAGDYGAQRRQAGALERQGNAEADLLGTNATLAGQQATDLLDRGREAEMRQRAASRTLLGSQRAALAASGVDIGSGSAADVVENDQHMGELDALTIRNNARRQAWGYQVQQSDYLRQAEFARSSSRQDAQGLRRGSIGTLLSGAGELANLYATAPKRVSSAPLADPRLARITADQRRINGMMSGGH